MATLEHLHCRGHIGGAHRFLGWDEGEGRDGSGLTRGDKETYSPLGALFVKLVGTIVELTDVQSVPSLTPLWAAGEPGSAGIALPGLDPFREDCSRFGVLILFGDVEPDISETVGEHDP
jgi:hypothetical protein